MVWSFLREWHTHEVYCNHTQSFVILVLVLTPGDVCFISNGSSQGRVFMSWRNSFCFWCDLIAHISVLPPHNFETIVLEIQSSAVGMTFELDNKQMTDYSHWAYIGSSMYYHAAQTNDLASISKAGIDNGPLLVTFINSYIGVCLTYLVWSIKYFQRTLYGWYVFMQWKPCPRGSSPCSSHNLLTSQTSS